jgi:hypothetical protein
MKRFLLIILGIMITGSIINNIKTQYGTLKEAERQNQTMADKITTITEDNKILEQKIEYATSSAFIEQELHDKLALGTENDVWLNLKKEENTELFPEVNETVEIPKIKQWISLFTR